MDPINKSLIQGPYIYLEVYDMPTSLRFYRDIIGFSIHQSSGEGDDVDWVMLLLGDSTLMLNTAYDREDRPAAPDPLRTKGHADITLYFGYPDIDAFYDYLLSKGIALEVPSVTKYHFKATGFSDPDGYRVCFHWPVE